MEGKSATPPNLENHISSLAESAFLACNKIRNPKLQFCEKFSRVTGVLGKPKGKIPFTKVYRVLASVLFEYTLDQS